MTFASSGGRRVLSLAMPNIQTLGPRDSGIVSVNGCASLIEYGTSGAESISFQSVVCVGLEHADRDGRREQDDYLYLQ